MNAIYILVIVLFIISLIGEMIYNEIETIMITYNDKYTGRADSFLDIFRIIKVCFFNKKISLQEKKFLIFYIILFIIRLLSAILIFVIAFKNF